MEGKEEVLAAHQEQVRKNRSRPSLFWKYSTVVLAVLLVLGLYQGSLFSFPRGVDMDVVNGAVHYLNEEVLQGLGEATLTDVFREDGLYTMTVHVVYINGIEEDFTSYLSLDGETLYPSAVSLSEGSSERSREEVSVEQDVLAGEPVLGNAAAPVAIVAYSDFECPFCAEAVPVLSEVLAAYPEDVRVVFKNFPLVSVHPQAYDAALAGECAFQQGMFAPYHDLLFEKQDALSQEDLFAYAEELGMDIEQFSLCFSSPETAAEVDQDVIDGTLAGVLGTPTFFIGEEMIVGPSSFEEFDAVLQNIVV